METAFIGFIITFIGFIITFIGFINNLKNSQNP